MHGRYPDYDVLERRRPLGRGDPRAWCSTASSDVPPVRFFTDAGGARAAAPSATSCSPRTREPRIPVHGDGRRQAPRRPARRLPLRTTCPTTPRPGGWSLRGLDEAAPARRGFAAAGDAARHEHRRGASPTASCGGAWDELPVAHAWSVVMRGVLVGVLLAPLGMERDRLRRPRLPARVHARSAAGPRARRGPTRRSRWTRSGRATAGR